MGVCLDSFRLHLSDCQQWLYLKCGRNGNFLWEFFVKWENISTFAIQKELFDISKAQRIGAVVMSLNRYQQLLTSLLTSVTQIDTIFFIIRHKYNYNFHFLGIHFPISSARKVFIVRFTILLYVVAAKKRHFLIFIKKFATDILYNSFFCLHLHHSLTENSVRKDGWVAETTSLLNWRTRLGYRGFESPSFRKRTKKYKECNRAPLFFYSYWNS